MSLDGNPELATGTWPATEWTYGMDQYPPVDDFDLNSLDTLLTDLTTGWIHGTNHGPEAPDTASRLSLTPLQRSRQRTPVPGHNGEVVHDQYTVDEQYSNDISRQLKPIQPSVDTVLSADFLNLCLQLYFEHFHPIFPIIHSPTFRPRTYNVLLLTSMCSIGSLFVGSPAAAAQGQQLYSRLNKAILASWEMHLARPNLSELPMIQAALLGQTFGMLSKKAADRFMTEAFQGTMLVWARSAGAFDAAETIESTERLEGVALNDAWIAWARKEELRRLGLALYVHDVEIACLFEREPIIRHHAMEYQSSPPDTMFQARSAEGWRSLYSDHQQRLAKESSVKINDWLRVKDSHIMPDVLAYSVSSSSFSAYAILAHLGGHIVELTRLGFLTPLDIRPPLEGLTKWYRSYSPALRDGLQDNLCLKILWQHYSLHLHADAAMLERAIGPDAKQVDEDNASSWVASPNALYTLLHVCLIHKHAYKMRLASTPPIHLPRAVFVAGIIFTAFFRFFSPTSNHTEMRRCYQIAPEIARHWRVAMLEMPSVEVLAEGESQQPQQIVDWACTLLVQRSSSLVYNCIDLLKKFSPWGVSEVFAESLESYARTNLNFNCGY